MKFKTRIKRILSLIIPSLSDNNVEYWDKAARIDPFAAICTGHSEQDFEQNLHSIIFHPQREISLAHKRVVDLCCGLGRMVPSLAPEVWEYFGIDFSIPMIVQARQRHQKVSNVFFMSNDGRTIPLPDESVDIVFCELAFQHMTKETVRSYVEDVYRILGITGVFLAQIPRMDFYHDKRFGFTLPEVRILFKKYEFIYLPFGEAYYLIRAVKEE